MTVIPDSFIHYGSSHYDPYLFTPVKDHDHSEKNHNG